MKYLVALLACAASTLALADTELKNVPPLLQKTLKVGGLNSAQFDSGVLRVQTNKSEVTELVYQTFVFHNICAQQWYEPQQFASLGLARVELLNDKGQQGFAFDARGDVCAEMGKLGKNFRNFIAQHSVACTGGSCPPQR
ncbi:MAG: hypothetical protein JSR53_13280 [Proteobacteria bacterium]|nr:hypothetical protein [Pseudomonadota bacterium]